jgi:hypothetical protein
MYDGLVITGREAFVPLPKLYFGNCLKGLRKIRKSLQRRQQVAQRIIEQAIFLIRGKVLASV